MIVWYLFTWQDMIFRTWLSCEYTESIMQYTSNQLKPSQDFTYIHMKGPSASYLALLAISNIPLRVWRDFVTVWFIQGLMFDKEMKWWCFRPLLCTLFRLNWAKQTPGIMRRNQWRNWPMSGFELVTQWSEAQHATAGLRRPPCLIKG